MVDDELDELYAARPEEFTTLRGRLATAAKRRGAADEAKAIAAARKPTAPAWVVNLLVHNDPGVRRRLAELGEQLRRAHAELDGARVRELSAHQRVLVKHLSADAFAAAGLNNPTATLRDDVAGTLQAAIADPEVAARLGSLTKPERWSGFGGDVPAIPTDDEATTDQPDADDDAEALASLAAAEAAKSAAAQAVSDRQRDLAAATLERDQAQQVLAKAERKLRSAEEAAERAEDAHRGAETGVADAQADLERRRG
jgi:hypothetical protein